MDQLNINTGLMNSLSEANPEGHVEVYRKWKANGWLMNIRLLQK